MVFQVAASLFTLLLTGVALYAVRVAGRESALCLAEHRKVAKALVQLDLHGEEIEQLRSRMNKISGRFFREVRREKEAAAGDVVASAEDDIDPALASMLAFQSAPPAKPQ